MTGSSLVFTVLTMLDAAMDSLNEDERAKVARAFANKYGNEISHDNAPTLTPMEWRVLRLLAEGETTIGVGLRAHMGDRTVGTHIASMSRKFGVKNRHGLVAEAFRRGML